MLDVPTKRRLSRQNKDHPMVPRSVAAAWARSAAGSRFSSTVLRSRARQSSVSRAHPRSHRCALGTSSSRRPAFRTPEARSSTWFAPHLLPREKVAPLDGLPVRKNQEPRRERRSRAEKQPMLRSALDPDPEGSARSLASRPDNVWTSRRSKSSPNHRRRVLPSAGSEGGRLPWGSSPFDACGGGQRLVPGLPPPATRRPRASSAPRRFAPPISCPALFHAGSALGLGAFRGFSSPVAGLAFRRGLPLLPFDIDRSRHRPGRTELRSRLQGFEHPESPFPTGRRYPVSVEPILS